MYSYCSIWTVTAVCRFLYMFVCIVLLCVPYVQLLQPLESDWGLQIAVHICLSLCNCVYLMYSYCSIWTVTAVSRLLYMLVCIVQLCVLCVQLLQHLDSDCGLQIAVHVCLSLCNCVYLMYSYCSIWTVTAVGRLLYIFVYHCAIVCSLCTVTAASGQ